MMPRHCFVFRLHKDMTVTHYLNNNNTTTYKAVLLFLIHDVWKVWWWLFTVFHIFSLKLHPDILVKRDRLVRCCCKVRFHQFIQTRHRVNAVAAWYCSKGRQKFILSISTFFSKCKFRIKISLFHLGLTFFSPSLIVATLLCTFKMRDRSKLTRISAISTCWWAFNSAGISH